MGDVLAASNDDFTEEPGIPKKRRSFFEKLKFKKKNKQKKEAPKKEKPKTERLSVDEEEKEAKVSIVEGAEPEVCINARGRRIGLAEKNETERILVKDKLHDTILESNKNDFGF